MFNTIKQLLGFGPEVDYAALLKQGAIILDVRSAGEYRSGHIKGSINMPVESLSRSMTKLKDKNKPLITCCASGRRSGIAKSMLKANGYTEVYNGGGWASLQGKLNAAKKAQQ